MATHPIVHVEIPAPDPKAAAQFYADVFDWKVNVDPTFDYHMFQAEGGPGGGFVSTSTDAGGMSYAVGGVLVYLGTDDIERDLNKVTQRGGTVVVPKSEIPNTGWFAVFTDPAGNRLGLFTPMQG
ncbi:MAG TPA: VOC family protein [Chloroflexota bacterium]|nr:VOC family protein [Chloroflexota bacterium]